MTLSAPAVRANPRAAICARRAVWGPGPRAAQALMLTVRARALLDGRLAPSVERCGALGAAGAGAPDGAVLRRPRAGRDAGRHHRRGRQPRTCGLRRRRDRSPRPPRPRRGAWPDRCRRFWPRPRCWRRPCMLGEHGRRRAGLGDEFWQYRPAHAGRFGADDRLAALGPVGRPFRAGTRMAGGADR